MVLFKRLLDQFCAKISNYLQTCKRRDKGDGSVWHAKKESHLRYSMLRWDSCNLQARQTEPSPLSPGALSDEFDDANHRHHGFLHALDGNPLITAVEIHATRKEIGARQTLE